MVNQNPAEVVTGVFDGALYLGGPDAAPVSGLSQNLTLSGYTDLGLFSDEGTTDTLPDAPAPTPIRAFQRAQVVRTLRTPSDEVPTRTVTLLQTNPEVIALAANAEVVHLGGNEIRYDIDSDKPRPHVNLVRDLITETSIEREWAPNAVVTSIGDRVANNDGTTRGWPVTYSCEWSPLIRAHVRVFSVIIPPDEAGDNVFSPSHADVAFAEEQIVEVVEAVEAAVEPNEATVAFTVPDFGAVEEAVGAAVEPISVLRGNPNTSPERRRSSREPVEV